MSNRLEAIFQELRKRSLRPTLPLWRRIGWYVHRSRHALNAETTTQGEHNAT
jgi:hypothetical protein